ncbi:MAG: sulfite exporter TauE/SafE family protein, partial [Gammaproteobacteria bacterium]
MSANPLLVDLLLAFNLGLLSQLHCIGMCGGVIGALAFALAPRSVERRGMLPFALAYNGGRIASYVLAGAAVGLLGARIAGVLPGESGYLALRIAAALVLASAGLGLLGVRHPGALLERLGARAWRVLRRPGQALVPIRSLPAAWLFGMIWGWLPCAMVYATLAFAASSAAPARAALIMAAFGLGTSPALIAAATLAGRAPPLLQRPAVRRAAGVFMLAAALAYPFMGALSNGAGHDHGQHHSPKGP